MSAVHFAEGKRDAALSRIPVQQAKTLQATSLQTFTLPLLYTPQPNLRHSSVEPKSRLSESIVILDFGAQYTQLIARRIREQNVFSVVLPCTASLAGVKS